MAGVAETIAAADAGSCDAKILVRVPLGRLGPLPGNSEHRAKVTTYVAVRDQKGRHSEVQHREFPIRVPNNVLLTALGK